jgi:hypothetical protein
MLEMPRNVRRFAWLWSASIALVLAELLLYPTPSASELRLGMTRAIQIGFIAGVAAATLAAQLPFFWLAVWRRKNWARWLLLVEFVAGTAYSVVFMFWRPSPPPGVDPSWLHMPLSLLVVSWFSLFTEIAAFYFLFTGDARSWFEGEIANRP